MTRKLKGVSEATRKAIIKQLGNEAISDCIQYQTGLYEIELSGLISLHSYDDNDIVLACCGSMRIGAMLLSATDFVEVSII